MKLAAGDRKSRAAPRPLHLQRAPWLIFIACVLASALLGCNIVQGFQDAGDSLFPEQSTHLAAPGLRLVSGGYRDLGVAAAAELYLLARGADAHPGRLFSMRYADPQPCSLENMVRFSATNRPSRSAPLFAYLYENVGQGRLHFADGNCKTYDLTFEDARLPVAETDTAVVVWAGSDLWLATPETGSQEHLAGGVEDVLGGVFGQRYAVRANGQVTLFDDTWKAQGTFGDNVTAVLRAGKSFFYTDSVGAHRIVESNGGAQALAENLLASDACSLASQDGTWVSFRSPCAGGKVLVVHEPSGQAFTLPFDADPTELKLIPALRSRGLDPIQDPFWFCFLRSGDTDDSRDTLYLRTPAGNEHALGAHGTLLQLRVLDTASETHGYALVDVAGETGRYLWWNAAGETRTLAQNVMWRPRRLIVDFDGTVGSLAVTSGDRLLVLAERVPWQSFEYQDITQQWTVLFHDLDGYGGQLSAFSDSIDELQATPPDKPFAVPTFSPVASNVLALRTSSLSDVLSGVIYFTDVDLTTRTGKLEYRNLELRFTAHVNDGVADYVVSQNEVLYSIPYGENAGIWLVAGK